MLGLFNGKSYLPTQKYASIKDSIASLVFDNTLHMQ